MNQVADYYDRCQPYYTWLYSGKSLGLHYGFWEKGARTHQEALTNQYQLVNNLLSPKAGELILDAGCGVGGASIWLAKETGAKFTGITLSSKQLAIAKKNARDHRVSDRINFRQMDFFAPEFKDASFDSVFFIESFCYSYPEPELLLRKVKRILKPDGKILISDGVFLRPPANNKEERELEKFFLGWKLKGENTPEEIIKALAGNGFKEIRFLDKTPSIKRTSEFIYRRGIIGYPILLALHFFHLVSRIEVDNAASCVIQKGLIDQGLMGYGVFYAEKK